jgi:peptidoglycan-N-acetylglucosamine deacetylase
LSLVHGIVGTGAAVVARILTWGAVALSSELFGSTLRHTPSSREIALTFDDGPNPAVTPQLLELFELYSVRATFFLIGKFAHSCPELVKEISMRGHLIGNHSYTHRNLFIRSPAGIREELSRCQDAIAAAAQAEPPRWMRPPYGFRSPLLQGECRRAGIRGIVMWSKICSDWKPRPPRQLIEKLSGVARLDRPHGDIVVLHDGDHHALGGDRHHVVAALEHWLPRWRDAGMEFVTIESSSASETSDTVRSSRA